MKLKLNNTFILNLGWYHFVLFLTIDFEMSCNKNHHHATVILIILSLI